MIEVTHLTDRKPIDEVGTKWPDLIAHKGVKFFDAYMDTHNDAARMLEFGRKLIRRERDDWEEEADFGYTIDGQECYLGYVPSIDLFILGYDVTHPDYKSAFFRMQFDGKEFHINSVERLNHGFYGYGPEESALKAVHRLYPDVIDLRLD